MGRWGVGRPRSRLIRGMRRVSAFSVSFSGGWVGRGKREGGGEGLEGWDVEEGGRRDKGLEEGGEGRLRG